jgi:hypothetical protein
MAYYDYYGWKPYVPVATHRAQAARAAAKLAKKGQKTSPVVIDGRKIAKTFWGKAAPPQAQRSSASSHTRPSRSGVAAMAVALRGEAIVAMNTLPSWVHISQSS